MRSDSSSDDARGSVDIHVTSVTKRYEDGGSPVEVFSDLSFDVPGGASVAVIGESGVGKTTLLNLLGTLERPTEGTIRIGEHEITSATWSAAKRAQFRGAHLGFVFQFHNLLPEFDARENVAFPLLINGTDRSEAYDRAEAYLTRVGMSHRLDHRPGALSGGEQQRVAIARALVAQPGVIFADEPTGNLDAKTASHVQDILLELQQEFKATLLVVTHSLELASRMSSVLELTANSLVERNDLF